MAAMLRPSLALLALLAAGLPMLAPRFTSYLTFGVHMALLGKYSPLDGREDRVLAHVLSRVPPGDAQGVLDAVDDFARTQSFLMNVGEKGSIVVEALNNMTAPPATLLELGTYTGYGAITIAAAARARNPHAKLFTVEVVPENAERARRMIAHAGLAASVEVLLGPLETHLPHLRQHLAAAAAASDAGEASAAPGAVGGAAVSKKIDFVFLDHMKELYISDLTLLREAGMLAPGSVVVADNILIPGAPEYRRFMDADAEFDTVWHECELEYTPAFSDMVGVSVFRGAYTVAGAAAAIKNT